MKRAALFLVVVVAIIAMVAPGVSAQPKVTITGFVDNITSWDRNLSTNDNNYARAGDKEWYARTRVRPDITAEVGTTKFVLGMEIDSTWGQTGATDGSANANPGGGPQRFGTTSGWDLNTDVSGIIEIKWAYTEFDMPIMPVPTRFRLGAQPWQAQYKLAALANGDFAGANVDMTFGPMAKFHFTWASIEEQSTGVRDGFTRGEDYAVITSVEITPFKGLDIRPIFSYANYVGVTSGASRQGRGGLGNVVGTFPTATGGGFGAAEEHRFTVGVDTRWRFGAFSLDPTIFYQFGSREQTTGGVLQNVGRDAWFVDIRGGWQAGPLLLELAGIYTTGNKAGHRIDLSQKNLKYYEPISTDTSYYAGWAEIWALGIDYFNIIHSTAAGLNPGVAIGYDKYGMMRLGARASYALTPAFTVRAAANANWAAEEVDSSMAIVGATGRTPVAGTDFNGDARYLGTEVNLGFQWRFVPNVALDVVGSYMFTGNAMSAPCVNAAATCAGAGPVNARNPQDVQAVTARVRYSW